MKLKFDVEVLCGDRDSQQDSFATRTLSEGVTLLAVADGHGDDGAEASRLTIDTFAQFLEQNYGRVAHSQELIEQLLGTAVSHTQEQITWPFSGSTLSALIVDETLQRAFVVQLGDSPLFIMHPDKEVSVFIGHNLDLDPVQVQEVELLGGSVFFMGRNYATCPGGQWGINMSRAFGDRELGEYIGRRSENWVAPLNTLSMGVVASDGLFSCSIPTADLGKYLWQHLTLPDDSRPPLSAALLDKGTVPGDNFTAIRFWVRNDEQE